MGTNAMGVSSAAQIALAIGHCSHASPEPRELEQVMEVVGSMPNCQDTRGASHFTFGAQALSPEQSLGHR